MKTKNYEKKTLVYSLVIITFILEIITSFYIFTTKIYQYKKITGVILQDNLILVYADKNDKRIIYKNKVLYINDKKTKYEIEEDRGVTIKNNKKDYSELILKLKLDGNYKLNDVVEITIQDKKVRLINLFKIIWEGDKNKKTK